MNTLIILGVALLIIVCGYAYAKYRDEKENNAIYTYMEDTENESSEPLQKNDYINLTRYNDDKPDSRVDAILSVLDKIHFWVMIIGIYILVKFIAAIIIFVCKGAVIMEVIEKLFPKSANEIQQQTADSTV